MSEASSTTQPDSTAQVPEKSKYDTNIWPGVKFSSAIRLRKKTTLIKNIVFQF